MAQVQQLIKYQEVDSKLLKIEQEAKNSEEWKNYSQAKSFLTKAPEKLEAMDAKAREMAEMLEKLQEKYSEAEETLKDFEHINELVDAGADLSFYKKNATSISESIKSMKNELNALKKSIKEADEAYQTYKKKTISVQKEYTEYSETYKKYKEVKVAEMDAVKKELTKLGKELDPEVLKKYETKRSERIFPIICAVKNDRCSKCGMELSILDKEKIAAGGISECENCHRFLYGE